MENTQAAPICMCVDAPSWGNLLFKKGTARNDMGTTRRSVTIPQYKVFYLVVFWLSCECYHPRTKITPYNPEKALFVKEQWFIFTPLQWHVPLVIQQFTVAPYQVALYSSNTGWHSSPLQASHISTIEFPHVSTFLCNWWQHWIYLFLFAAGPACFIHLDMNEVQTLLLQLCKSWAAGWRSL